MTVGLHIVRAASRLDRLRGLIARSRPAPRHALLIVNCSSVHAFGMAYPIDVVFIDRDWCVMRVASLRPFGMRACRGACAVLELRSGEADRLGIAAGVRISPADVCADDDPHRF